MQVVSCLQGIINSIRLDHKLQYFNPHRKWQLCTGFQNDISADQVHRQLLGFHTIVIDIRSAACMLKSPLNIFYFIHAARKKNSHECMPVI